MSYPQYELVAEQRARLAVARAFRKEFDLAAQLIAYGEMGVSEVIALIRAKTARATIASMQRRKTKRELDIRKLTKIKGIGKKTAEHLISEFGSLEAVAKATLEQLQTVPGIAEKRAKVIARGVPKLIH
jgi:ERCC4-type nuclease